VDGNEKLAERLEEVERRERAVEKREKAATAKGLRHNLYEHITCSVGTVDIIIAACAALIVGLTVFGALSGGGR
jgi:hypothetical protein